jgi:hypothetical protein
MANGRIPNPDILIAAGIKTDITISVNYVIWMARSNVILKVL